MPTSNGNAPGSDFVVERRIKIGVDALSPEERQIVEDMTSSKTRFLAWIADPEKVGKLRPDCAVLLAEDHARASAHLHVGGRPNSPPRRDQSSLVRSVRVETQRSTPIRREEQEAR